MTLAANLFPWRSQILKSDLQPTTRLVLLTLSCHMNDAGESCYPSVERLVKETGLTKRTVITHLQIAKDLGWIGSRKHGFAGQAWARNEYYISWPKGGEIDSPPGKGGESNAREGGESVAEGGEINRTKAVKEMHLSTSVSSTVSTSLFPSSEELGAQAPAPPVDNFPPDTQPTEIGIWDVWLAIPGVREAGRGARSHLGKLIAEYGEFAAARAVAEVSVKKPADPQAFLERLLKQNPTTGRREPWQVIPINNDDVVPWALKWGYSKPRAGEEWPAYRSRLRVEIEQRSNPQRAPPRAKHAAR